MAITITRNSHIDALKGFAILLVVFGHSLQDNLISPENNILYRVIYSFHMPLFMFLSGLVMYGKNIDLKKKALGLVVPFIAWYHVKFLLQFSHPGNAIGYIDFIWRWIRSPDWGLWYFWALFLNLVFLKLVLHYANSKVKGGLVIALSAAYLLVQQIPTNLFGIGYIKWYFLFFGIGYLFPYYKDKIRLNQYFKIGILILFTLCAGIWYTNHPPVVWQFIATFFSTHKLPRAKYILDSYERLTPILGIASSYILIPKKLNYWWYKLLTYLGRRSFDIYVIHQFIMIGLGSGLLKIVDTVAIAIIGSLYLAWLIGKVKILSVLLLGKQNIPSTFDYNKAI